MTKMLMNARQIISQNDELLDLVDENDRVIGNKKRSEIYREGLSNFRVVNAFLENSRGELLILRRSATQRLFPLSLDMSMGGHVSSGESYEDALRRELKEELDLNLDSVPCHLLGYLTPHKDGVSAFTKIYEIKTDHTPNFNQKIFTECFWLSPHDIIDRIENGDPAKDDLPKIIRRLYLV